MIQERFLGPFFGVFLVGSYARRQLFVMTAAGKQHDSYHASAIKNQIQPAIM